MLSTTIVHACARCGSEHVRKNGHAENGDQRAKCLAGGRTFVLQPKGTRYGEKFRDQVVAAYQDRMSIRGITRTFGVCYKTVIRLGEGKKVESLPAFVDTLLPAGNGDVLGLDELWSFVGRKASQLWLWVALGRRTRQIVGGRAWATAVCKARVIGRRRWHRATGVVPPATTSGRPAPQPLHRAR